MTGTPHRRFDQSIRYYDRAGPRPLSSVIVEELTVVGGVGATDAERLLRETVDLDALDALFGAGSDDPNRDSVELVFAIDGYRITVVATGRIEIVPLAGPTRGRDPLVS
jgi:hypothetical protein